ncbi:hypothetical protein RYB20_22510, partial [Pseudomonas syringae pv. actinidifoliorum]|nr:hypothetical protein [Pseudomonas syringae pv. actinidifoliorum]
MGVTGAAIRIAHEEASTAQKMERLNHRLREQARSHQTKNKSLISLHNLRGLHQVQSQFPCLAQQGTVLLLVAPFFKRFARR